MSAPVLGLTSAPRPNSIAATLSAFSRSAIPPISSAAVHAISKILPTHFNGLRASVHQRKLSSTLFADTARAVRQANVVCEVQETIIEVPDVTKATWQSLVNGCDKPVLVEFWASWCEPCRVIGPVIGKLAMKYEGMMRFFRLNTDENPDIATQYGVRSIPTVVILKKGEKMEKVIGAVPEYTLITFIEGYLDG